MTHLPPNMRYTPDPIVTCDLPPCDWWTGVDDEAGSALAAVTRLRHHLTESHGRSDYEALREALDAVREAVPE